MAYGDLLSPSKAVEEFQGGIIRCLRVMLRSFLPCFAASCTCKQVSKLHKKMLNILSCTYYYDSWDCYSLIIVNNRMIVIIDIVNDNDPNSKSHKKCWILYHALLKLNKCLLDRYVTSRHANICMES